MKEGIDPIGSLVYSVKRITATNPIIPWVARCVYSTKVVGAGLD